MALACGTPSDVPNEDLEDGEIEDDDEEIPEAEPQKNENTTAKPPVTQPEKKFEVKDRPVKPDKRKYEDKKKPRLTEAEKHVMHLHKLERLEREKRERFKREQGVQNLVDDDFASNIEKAIADVLNKDKKQVEDDKDEEKFSRKRKKKDKDKRKNKQRRIDSLKDDEFNENEQFGSPDSREQSGSPKDTEYDSYESEASSDRSEKQKKRDTHFKKNNQKMRGNKFNNRDRNMRQDNGSDDNVCKLYLHGKCKKGDMCPYSHDAGGPVKHELCKFYMMDRCAKGDKCLYMHSSFPCKFYHTGLPCYAGENCKFDHGKPLTEALKQVLIKHMETAPRDILGGFPRMSREETVNMINQTQKSLEAKFGGKETSTDSKSGIPSLFEINVPVPLELMQQNKDEKPKDKPVRNRPSRWQDPDPLEKRHVLQQMMKGFCPPERGDQDLRINTNGDIDMRTLPPQIQLSNLGILSHDGQMDTSEIGSGGRDVDIRNANFLTAFAGDSRDVDSRQLTTGLKRDVDIRQLFDSGGQTQHPEDASNTDERAKTEDSDLPLNLPKTQRDLFLRIQAQQKDNVVETQKDTAEDNVLNNDNWYSDDEDDDDDDRLMIKVDNEDVREKNEEEDEDRNDASDLTSLAKPAEVMEKLGDLSKIDISPEVTKLLSSISQSTAQTKTLRDPRQAAATQESSKAADPRLTRLNSVSEPQSKNEKLSIYEQGGISVNEASRDVDLRTVERDLDLRGSFGDTDFRGSRPDIDLRQLTLPFKAIQNYTPASEIDASINSHPPIQWRVHVVDVPKPDYAGLKLTVQDAQMTGDPRLRKMFRLSTEEKESPASPKQSPKSGTSGGVRVDPRIRKQENVDKDMNYTQQLNLLMSSAFYQSLTSNQKLLLNQELANQKSDHTGSGDPLLNSILSNLGLVANAAQATPNLNALSILASVNNLTAPQINPAVLANNPLVQPGLLGPAPGIPPINFDPRNGGLLGNAPPFFAENQFGFGNEEFYPDNGFRSDNRFQGNRGRRGRFGNRGGNANRKFNNRSIVRNNRGHSPA